jgi:hypothetical protein
MCGGLYMNVGGRCIKMDYQVAGGEYVNLSERVWIRSNSRLINLIMNVRAAHKQPVDCHIMKKGHYALQLVITCT